MDIPKAIFLNDTCPSAPLVQLSFLLALYLLGPHSALNLVIGVIMNSMDESNAEIAAKLDGEKKE